MRLFNVVYEVAREHGAGRIYWHTQQFNGAARSLYDTVGQLTSFVVYEPSSNVSDDLKLIAASRTRDQTDQESRNAVIEPQLE